MKYGEEEAEKKVFNENYKALEKEVVVGVNMTLKVRDLFWMPKDNHNNKVAW